jgi:hypothetical protein
MNFLEKNLNVLIKIDPELTAFLYSIQTNKKFEVYMDEKDDININILDKENNYIFYPTKPVDEVTNQYEEIMSKKSRYPVLTMYGFANGLLIRMFLNLDKYIVVIEPEIELIYIALNLFDFSEYIENKKFYIVYSPFGDFHKFRKIYENPDIKVFLKIYDLEITNNYYMQFFRDDIINKNRLITEIVSHLINIEGNSAEDSLIGLDHHLKHIPKMLKSYTLESVAKNRNTDNAVIVSTGPSLAKQLPLLKEYQDYITILCIDASLPILQKEGIKPDLVFSMERVEATSKFFENLDRELLKDTIFIPTSVSHPKTLQNLEGTKVSVSMRPFSYNRMFKLNKWGYIGIGMSAANMALDFAYVAKFKNIAFIGQDLAFGEDGKTHSKGAVYGEEEKQYKKNTLKIKGYYGEEIETSSTWKMFLDFFVRDIPEIKKEGRNVYNCTEGGAYIEGAEHIPFKEFLDKIEKTPKKVIKGKFISEKRQNHYLYRSQKLINLYIERLSCIKEKVEKTFLKVMENIEYLEKLNRDSDLEKIDFDELANVISEIDKIKDILEEDKVIKRFSNITNPLIVSAELELAKIMVRESNTEIEKKVKMIDWIYEHKSWLFFLAAALDNIIYLMKNNKVLE